ncbi:MAG: phenylalanine--tRNA ligase subunit alpha [Clostridiales bacterium]|nr:phenylalanine--tRNA ligase subunit alpha [Clostridiales bacterium]
MKEQLLAIKEKALDSIENCTDIKECDAIRITFLGKKGQLTAILKQMGRLSAEERPVIGQMANEIRTEIEKTLVEKQGRLKLVQIEKKLEEEAVDVTVSLKEHKLGKAHPLTQTINEISAIFAGMGYTVVDGPEIDTVARVFDLLNAEENHPSRDPSDTFYIDDNTLLRTQTSSVQIRVMQEQKPPIAIISPGRVYRRDEVDATHSPIFHQCEGLVVDKGLTFGDLKGTLIYFAKQYYGEDMELRFRPHHFPFTEPSCEIDCQCFKCHGKGCPTCKGEGWIEILGAGMVHPNVLRNCGIDPEIYSGFAFGMGIERLTMFKHEIEDMRLLYENNLRFLSQF